MNTLQRFMSALILAGVMLSSARADAQIGTNTGFKAEPVSLVDFKKTFNGDTGKIRLVLMFSPT